MAPTNVQREAKLMAIFHAITEGKMRIQASNDAKNFLDGFTILCQKKSSSFAVEIVISRGETALDAVRAAVRNSLSHVFLSSSTLPFIAQLAAPDVETLSSGDFLSRIILEIVYPPTFWNGLVSTHAAGQLSETSIETFAWLCLQVINIRRDDGELSHHIDNIEGIVLNGSFDRAASHKTRVYHCRIKKILASLRSNGPTQGPGGSTPGGRHDNDFADFREISLLPTNDELLSKERPFLPRLEDVFQSPNVCSEMYLDWMFRLLREEMLAELRDDLKLAQDDEKKTKPLILTDLYYAGYNSGTQGKAQLRSSLCSIYVSSEGGLEFLTNMESSKARKYLKENPRYLRHQSLAVLYRGMDVVSFGSLIRKEDDLIKHPPILTIQFEEATAFRKSMQCLMGPERSELRLIFVNTAMFAFEPILKRLQQMRELPLDTHLLTPKDAGNTLELPANLHEYIAQWKSALQNGKSVKIPTKSTKKSIEVRDAQLESLINGLTNPVALIQGPPGTGKSFIGALIALILLEHTDFRILLLSYTNHAVDQFVEDLFEIGVESDVIVRLGSKSTQATERVKLDKYLKDRKYFNTRVEWDIINDLNLEQSELREKVSDAAEILQRRPTPKEIIDYLEFSQSSDDDGLWDAFQVPEEEEGFVMAMGNQKAMTPERLYLTWRNGVSSQIYASLMQTMSCRARSIWDFSYEKRCQLHARWEHSVRDEQITTIFELVKQQNELHRQTMNALNESKRRVLSGKRVIACTTTAAAMYESIIGTAKPDVVILEESGQILEAHTVTAFGSTTQQAILIGDHRQLPPKVNNYALTKEKGDGYDLNVSMFERLIRHGHDFTTLSRQHRSHPDISSFAKMLAYDSLEDVEQTRAREQIRGLETRVAYVHHEHPENALKGALDRQDPTSKATRANTFEAQMVLKMVKYLGQQGYGTGNMVILTPYLGQLYLLQELLKVDNDPCLNDLDSGELVRAGMMTSAAAKLKKKPIRLATIDNYQGEESDIVIVSLTRSNDRGDIGFLSARERLVVLMSRARNGIIIFGNMHTFLKSKKGKEFWTQYFEHLQENQWMYDGVPVRCERHPEFKISLKTPEDFDLYCPEGGCSQQCNESLNCGHKCPRRCHRILDHTKATCDEPISRTCTRDHKEIVPCGKKTQPCKKCAVEDEVAKKRAKQKMEMEKKRLEAQAKAAEDMKRRLKRDKEMEKKRLEALDKYRKELQEVDDDLDQAKRTMEYAAEQESQLKELKDKKERLKEMQESLKVQQKQKQHQSQVSSSKSAQPRFNSGSSDAKDNWEFQKVNEGARSAALDEIMELIGLESVKQEFLSTKNMVDTKIRQGVSLSGERFSCSLLGNPGTGKTTVARLWAKFLVSLAVIPGSTFKETTGSKLASDGVKGCEAILEDIKNSGGGVLFIDEAYQLSSGNSPGGKSVLDFLLAEVENLRGKVVFVLAGYSKQMESFFSHNPGFPSRFPIEMKFEDYDDKQLLDIFRLQLHKKFHSRMKIEGGSTGLYARIATRRVGYSRGKEGFGNARAVENCMATICKRQATRLQKERQSKGNPDDFLMTKEDMIGPEPSDGLKTSKGWNNLQGLIGLKEVKETVKVLLDTIQTNYERELAEEPLVQLSLNKVFLGSPGTGKTTVAKFYGQILVDLGLLSNGEVVVKNPADFIGAHLGESEANTKGILAATVGKVLVIDEAYGLYGGGGAAGGGAERDFFKTSVIDTIVAEVQSVPGDDRCVLLLGYQDKMETMFQNVNPGLSRRFPMDSAFVFVDFDDEALGQILDSKLKSSGFKATEKAKAVAIEVLRRARNRPNFGNAGEIDNLLGTAKISLQKRVSSGKAVQKGLFEAVDFDPDFDRADRANTNVRKLFESEVGRESVIKLLEGYQKRVRDCKELDIDPEIPFNFLFRGPPGTGKTSTARKIGKVFYDMGFLASAKVDECSASDFVGEYIGHTGPKVRRRVEKALGRVLLIDEAYRLGKGQFGKEALDELVDLTTKPEFKNKLIIILAGYAKDINSLMTRNPGMTSRFPEVIDFHPLDPGACVELMVALLKKMEKILAGKGRIFDITCLTNTNNGFPEVLKTKFSALSRQDGWASGRDVENLTKSISRALDISSQTIELSSRDVITCIDNLFRERQERMENKLDEDPFSRLKQAPAEGKAPQMKTSTSTTTVKKTSPEEKTEAEPVIEPPKVSSKLGKRDVGVSDEVWEQLQRDAAEEDRKAEELRELKRKEQSASDADRERVVRQIIEGEERAKQEAAMKQKLMALGVCPMGWEWIKQNGGYRCAGGSHYMSDGDVGRL